MRITGTPTRACAVTTDVAAAPQTEKVECDLCCAAIFCPCAVLNSNVKMMQTRTYHPPCEFECTKPCSIMACLTVASAVIRVVGQSTGIFLDLLNLGPLYSFQWRSALREKYGINGDPCSDCICHWCCNPCVLCQEHIELRKRNGGPTGLPPHAIVMAQPYAGGWTQGYAPGQQAMPAAGVRRPAGRRPRTGAGVHCDGAAAWTADGVPAAGRGRGDGDALHGPERTTRSDPSAAVRD